MRLLQLNSVGGASGDMILGTLIDLGASVDELTTALRELPIDPFAITVEPAEGAGMHGTRATVELETPEHHVHRHLSDILPIIDNSNLPDPVKAKSARVFRCIAEAEATVHNTTPEKIHFHEVGAMDSIIDIIGSCLALHLLKIDGVIVNQIPVGTGTIQCAHGEMPIPVPATVEILKGEALTYTEEPFEMVTPTGAALLKCWKTASAPPAGARITTTGIGFGQRTLNSRPNIIRGMILDTETLNPSDTSCMVLECNLDDTTAELIGALTVDLLEKGAVDVFTSSIQMKKQRAGTLLTVICHHADREIMIDTIFAGSTTFGIREYAVHRTVLDRRHETVDTEYGPIRIKIGSWKGSDITHSPEYEDCARAAKEHNVPVITVYDAAKHHKQ